MLIKFPKDTLEIHWTSHVKRKMIFYGLSEQKIRSVIRSPKRQEDGVAPQTVAVMQRNDKPKRKEELWVMYANNSKVKSQNLKLGIQKPKIIIVSAWRYPGVSKKRDGVPVPDDVAAELEKFLGNENF